MHTQQRRLLGRRLDVLLESLGFPGVAAPQKRRGVKGDVEAGGAGFQLVGELR